MADVDKLFTDYVAEHRAGGEADPRAYLERVEGIDRDELATLIDAYLVRSPGRRWDPDAYQGSRAQALATGVERSIGGEAGAWPLLLPRLRERAKIKRAVLVARLAAALGVSGQTEKVAGYYHEMEQGSLDSSRGLDRCWKRWRRSSGRAPRRCEARGEVRRGPAASRRERSRPGRHPRPEYEAKGAGRRTPGSRGRRPLRIPRRRGGRGRSPLHRRRLSRPTTFGQ